MCNLLLLLGFNKKIKMLLIIKNMFIILVLGQCENKVIHFLIS